MHTAYLPIVATRCQYQYRGGPQVNKFEQVSIDGRQISLAGELGPWGPLQ